jgi:hypothetical protein
MSDSELQNSGRRQLLRKASLGLLAAPFALALQKLVFGSSTAFAQAPAAGAKLEMLKEADPQAQALGYKEDAKKVDVKKWPKRAGAAGSKQFCYSCQFYQAPGTDPKAAAVAPCQIFAGKGVKANAWCNTWTQNPKVKS